MSPIPPQLDELAQCFGVSTSYQDVYKKRRDISVETVLAVLKVLGVDLPGIDKASEVLGAERRARLERGIEPVIVDWEGESQNFPLTLPAETAAGKLALTIELEDLSQTISKTYDLGKLAPEASPCGRFKTVSLPIPKDVGRGYHSLSIEHRNHQYRSLLISAPLRAYSGEEAVRRDWGCFLPLYSLRSERNWGAGDFTDLHNFTHWVAEGAGSLVGTLPMLAAYLDEPCEPSPYAPASRLAWNEFYVDVERIPEFAACPQATQKVGSNSFQNEVERLRTSDFVEYRKLMALKRQVLEQLADEFFQKKPASRFAQYERFLKTHPHGEDYAEFRAAQERQRSVWQDWPDLMRRGQLMEKDYDQRNKQYHLYVQWVATNQLENLAEASGGGLYLDLPLGVRPDGYDVWRWHDYYACEASAGSPPDAMWTKGQNWGFPPLHPERIREAGYRHVRDYLRHHLRLARILRIDHVMQLHRLYCVPHGLGAHQGAYVQYRPEEFYAILNLESHRCRAALVGENLGTVPPEVNQAMQKHFVQPMYVVQYEIAEEEVEEELAEENQNQPAAKATVLRNVPADSLASMNTHDMATFAAWWRGEDIWLRRDLDLIDQQEADRQYEELQTIRNELINWLRSNNWLEDSSREESQILMAIFKFLSAGPAEAVLVNLEDLWLETRPQNVPGTGSERPNWKRKAAVTYEEFTKSPEVLSILQMVARLRRQAQTEAMKQS